MNKKLVGLIALLGIGSVYNTALEARGGAIAGGFIAGALIGSALSRNRYYNDCRYRERPPYDYFYPGAPRYAYDYPAYVYSPVYAYSSTRYTVYPSYYLTP